MNLLFLTFVFPLLGYFLLAFSRGRISENLAAAEAAIGLAILLQLYRRFNTLDVDAASEMRG